jgi:hypothetical protein
MRPRTPRRSSRSFIAMGADASLTGMFVSYVVASVFRMLGILPGGLGSFDVRSLVATFELLHVLHRVVEVIPHRRWQRSPRG